MTERKLSPAKYVHDIIIGFDGQPVPPDLFTRIKTLEENDDLGFADGNSSTRA